MQSMLVALWAVFLNLKAFRLVFLVFLRCIVAGKAFCADKCNPISHNLTPFASVKYSIHKFWCQSCQLFALISCQLPDYELFLN